MAQARTVLLSLLVLSVSLTSVYGSNMECEDLPMELCAFAVSSSGARCLLEKNVMRDGSVLYECQTSGVMAGNTVEWIETDDCINACGLERMSVGLSTDALVEREFTEKLCSLECEGNCPNVVNLFTNLAAGEGVYLPNVCEAVRSKSRRFMMLASRSLYTQEASKSLAPESQPFAPGQAAFAPAPF